MGEPNEDYKKGLDPQNKVYEETKRASRGAWKAR
jgi:hypothetical protein